MRILLFTTESEDSYILNRDMVNEFSNEIKGIYVSKTIKPKKIYKILSRKVFGGLGFRYYLQRLIHSYKHNKTKNTIYELAKKNEIPIYYTSNFNDLTQQIRDSNPDVIISGYIDHIIRSDLLDVPSFGIINVHLSLLPKYRGVKPVFWVINNNEKSTGVSLHLMDKGIDTGDLLDQKEIVIFENDTVSSLTKRLSEEGAKLLINNLHRIKTNKYVMQKQDSARAIYYSQPTKMDLKQFIETGKKFF